MKLSKMNTKQLAAALCQLTAPMSRIAGDGELNGVFTRLKNEMRENKHMTTAQKASVLLEAVPMLLETHYDDAIAIISIMTGKSVPEVEAKNGFEMIDELCGCIDTKFLDFFKSSAVMGKTSTGKSE